MFLWLSLLQSPSLLIHYYMLFSFFLFFSYIYIIILYNRKQKEFSFSDGKGGCNIFLYGVDLGRTLEGMGVANRLALTFTFDNWLELLNWIQFRRIWRKIHRSVSSRIDILTDVCWVVNRSIIHNKAVSISSRVTKTTTIYMIFFIFNTSTRRTRIFFTQKL